MALWLDLPSSPDWTNHNEQDCEAITNIMCEIYDEAITDAATISSGMYNPVHITESIMSLVKGKYCLSCKEPSGVDVLCEKHAKKPELSGAW